MSAILSSILVRWGVPQARIDGNCGPKLFSRLPRSTPRSSFRRHHFFGRPRPALLHGSGFLGRMRMGDKTKDTLHNPTTSVAVHALLKRSQRQ